MCGALDGKHAAGMTKVRTVSTNSQLAIFIGLQGCGKTTFFNARLAATHVHVSKDEFRNAKNRNKRQAQLIEAALGQSRSVAVDNTNPTSADREPLIELGRSGAT
jgi:signal recognition particle GTPase